MYSVGQKTDLESSLSRYMLEGTPSHMIKLSEMEVLKTLNDRNEIGDIEILGKP